jgi:hypothetical protein
MGTLRLQNVSKKRRKQSFLTEFDNYLEIAHGLKSLRRKNKDFGVEEFVARVAQLV